MASTRTVSQLLIPVKGGITKETKRADKVMKGFTAWIQSVEVVPDSELPMATKILARQNLKNLELTLAPVGRLESKTESDINRLAAEVAKEDKIKAKEILSLRDEVWNENKDKIEQMMNKLEQLVDEANAFLRDYCPDVEALQIDIAEVDKRLQESFQENQDDEDTNENNLEESQHQLENELEEEERKLEEQRKKAMELEEQEKYLEQKIKEQEEEEKREAAERQRIEEQNRKDMDELHQAELNMDDTTAKAKEQEQLFAKQQYDEDIRQKEEHVQQMKAKLSLLEQQVAQKRENRAQLERENSERRTRIDRDSQRLTSSHPVSQAATSNNEGYYSNRQRNTSTMRISEKEAPILTKCHNRGDHEGELCPFCNKQHSCNECTLEESVIQRMCANTGRCIKCRSDQHKTVNCELYLLEKEDNRKAEIALRATSTPRRNEENFTFDVNQYREGARMNNNDFRPFPSNSSHSQEAMNRREDVSSHTFNQARKVLTQFNGESSIQYSRFRATLLNAILSPDFPWEWKRKALEDNLTGKAKELISDLNDAKSAVEKTLERLDNTYLAHNSIEDIRNQFESINLDTKNGEQFGKELNKLVKAHEKLEEAQVVLDARAATQLLARMPFKIRQRCAEEHKTGKMTVEFVIKKAERYYSDYLADQVIRKSALHLLAKPNHQSTINVHHLNTMEDSESELEETDQSTEQTTEALHTTTSTNKKTASTGPKKEQRAKPVFTDNGSPDCPSRNSGPQMSYDTAKQTRIENPLFASAFNLGTGYQKDRLQFTFTYDKEREYEQCPLCGSGHRLLHCPKSSSNVRKYLLDNKKCINCTSSYHQLRDCESTFTCYYCSGKHHIAACRLKEFFRDVRNFPADATKPTYVKFFREQSHQ